MLLAPAQTTICLPVHTAVWKYRRSGAPVVVVGVQVSVLGSYLPPVFTGGPMAPAPPQTTISLLVHTAVWESRPVGALVVLVAVQLSVLGLYLPPVLNRS